MNKVSTLNKLSLLLLLPLLLLQLSYSFPFTKSASLIVIYWILLISAIISTPVSLGLAVIASIKAYNNALVSHSQCLFSYLVLLLALISFIYATWNFIWTRGLFLIWSFT